MQAGAGLNRRGAKARRLNKRPNKRSPLHDQDQNGNPRQLTPSHKDQHNYKQAIQPARSTSTWAEAIGHPRAPHTIVPHRTPTYHTVAIDAGLPHPFEPLPHLLLTGRYSGSTLSTNELVFRFVFPAEQSATRELLQSHRTAAQTAIRKRLGINLLPTDALGDVITIVTKNRISLKKTGSPQGTSGCGSPLIERPEQLTNNSVTNTIIGTRRRRDS